MAVVIDDILDLFGQISEIPRCSKNEAAISRWVADWAATAGHECSRDSVGNLLVRVAGRGAGMRAAPVVLQSHMDMVCEKTPQSSHDFRKDPIKRVVDGEWLRAEGTTLGADNGIGMALAIYAANPGLGDCPPLELLFTVDEETGLNGANGLESGFLEGACLLNLDSEQEGVFTVGCAGGRDTHLTKAYATYGPPTSPDLVAVTVAGLQGGHSGVDIHLQRANANQLLARTLKTLFARQPFQLHSLKGGSAHNAIARDARAVVCPDEAVGSVWQGLTGDLVRTFRREWGDLEPTLQLEVQSIAAPEAPFLLPRDATLELLNLMTALPHGVIRRSSATEVMVETSCNLAIVELERGNLKVISSQRSLLDSRLLEITERIHALGGLVGAEACDAGVYPPWTPRTGSSLLAGAQAVYREQFGRDARVRTIHAGLECGIIGNLYPEMDMISLGPTIRDAHSPRESLHLPSVERVWQFLTALLQRLC